MNEPYLNWMYEWGRGEMQPRLEEFFEDKRFSNALDLNDAVHKSSSLISSNDIQSSMNKLREERIAK